MRGQQWRFGMAAVLVASLAGGAVADVTIEQSASILVFPKVVSDGTRDTIIQITSTSNSMVHAHCFYVNGALTFPDLDPGPLNPPLWTEIDFDIWLTRQQPTHWVVSEGRLVDPSDPPCSNAQSNLECSNAGLDPGRVPPVVEGFTGELKCIEVDATGAPLSGNHLKGEATLTEDDRCIGGTCSLSGTLCVSDDTCDRVEVAKYNAVGILGNELNDGDPVLCLGGPASESCPLGAEYNACPQTWILSHFSDGAEDPFVGAGSSVTTNISIVPCSENFETQVPTSVTVQFAISNEFEQPFSASTTVTCWADLRLSEINEVFLRSSLGTVFASTRLRSASGSNSGFIVVADEHHDSGSEVSWAAWNWHWDGLRTAGDVITIPAEQAGAE